MFSSSNRHRIIQASAFVGAMVLSHSVLWADSKCLFQHMLAASNPDTEDRYGYAVAVDGDVAVVGAFWEDGLADNAGAAYVYRYDGTAWVEEQMLAPSDLTATDLFGYSVALQNDVIIVGAILSNETTDFAGAVYVFQHDGTEWIQVQKLLPSAVDWNENFSVVLSLDGESLAVGAARHSGSTGVYLGGAVYLFRHDGDAWVEEQIITPADLEDEDLFGSSISLDGASLLVGKNTATDSDIQGYLFTYSGGVWTEQPALVAENGDEDYGGVVVSLSGNRALISPADWQESLGQVHLFDFDGQSWNLTHTFLSPDGDVSDGFGMAVAIEGDRAVISSPYDDEAGPNYGSAYVYRFDGSSWVEQGRLYPGAHATDGLFGAVLSLTDNRLIVGTPHDNIAAIDGGSAYIFMSLEDNDCNTNLLIDSCDIAAGTSQDCDGDNVPDECQFVDCNANGNLDACDILTGFSGDCQSDGVPDECQGLDCNDNGVLDECDVADGSSADANFNNIPDECEEPCLPGECVVATNVTLTDPAAGDYFGGAVAISGGLAALCAYGDDREGGGSGSVTFYRCDGDSWSLDEKVFSTDTNTAFGLQVALDGNVAVISGHTDLDTVYVWRLLDDGWSEWQTLTPSDGAENNFFGYRVAVAEEWIVVASLVEVAWQEEEYIVYVFRRSGDVWSEDQILEADGLSAYSNFGSSVSVVGDWMFVGDPLDDSDGVESGAVYVYRYDGSSWVQHQKLLGNYYSHFGTSIDSFGDALIVGAHFEKDDGAAFIYRETETGWELEAELESTDYIWPYASYFGISVGMGPDVAIVGATWDRTVAPYGGAVYVFSMTDATWSLSQKFSRQDTADFDYFGGAVDISDLAAVAGFGLDDEEELESTGSAYLMSRYLDDCNGNGLADDCDVDQGTSLDCNANGVPDECDADCNENAYPDDCDIADGLSFDCDASGVPDECENDCNGNLLEDSCDIAEGTSPDCQLNGIPDECEVDCNENTIPDDCDITAGVSLDGNSNGVPDECEDCDQLTRIDRDGDDLDDYFGAGVALDGETMVIGAYGDDLRAEDAGAAFVYQWDGATWQILQELIPPDWTADEHFGYRTAIHGDVIAATKTDDGGLFGPGVIYVFRNSADSWVYEAKLSTTVPPHEYLFGDAIDVDDDIIVVGDYGDDEHGAYAGRAVAFELYGTLWRAQDLHVDGVGAYDHFGEGVAVNSDHLLVSAAWDHDLAEYGGAVYTFRRVAGEWVQQQKVFPHDPKEWQLFGSSLAMTGDVMAVGTYSDDEVATQSGAVYIFRFDGEQWVEEQKLIASDAKDSTRLGWSLAAADDFVIAGTWANSAVSIDLGAAYVFRDIGGSWIEEAKLIPADAVGSAYFGIRVGAAQGSAVIGMPFDDADPAAYVYGALAGHDCNANGNHDGCEIWQETTPDCNSNSIPDECDISGGTSQDEDQDGVPDECPDPPCEGDANGDGLVDPLDSGFVLARFGCPVGTGDEGCDIADMNGDGLVDPLDVGFVLARFGTCD